jgi:4-amino-4-deoxy-L-arabinose transferase-like glycosyltransferase
MGVMFSGVFLSRFSPDESQWIYTTRYLTLFRQGDFASPEWNNYWTHTQPPLARYMMGSSLRLAGFDLLHVNGPWDFTKEADENRALGNVPTSEMVFWARLPMGFVAAGAVLLLFLIARRIGGVPAGIGAAAWLAANPRSRELMTRAEADGLLIATILLGLYLTLVLLEQTDTMRQRPASTSRKAGIILVLGIVLGLGISTKLTGALTLFACVLILAAVSLKRWQRNRETAALGSSLAGPLVGTCVTLIALTFIAFTLFVVLNPALYENPPANTAALFSFRQDEMQQQMAAYPSAALSEGLPRIESALVRTMFTYSVSAGLTRAAFGDGALQIGQVLPVDLLLVASGLFFALRMLFRDRTAQAEPLPAENKALAILTALVFSGVFFFGISLNMGLDWDRYTLPLWVFAALWAGVGIGGIWTSITGLITRRRVVTPQDVR